ncbi:eukaryotic elongation factor-1 B gamma [Ectocarpus siliculosus]|uniref:Eukaryotic elongation factor-1 B gamma n=1 Tax=Ectocarpus siliculosus TaxID=2880 RepID=D7G6C4_ECTSI|nr:eukaryotic elongation factor-1 B gamma [Ectocarpus siliculosus]|eukprot:CBJ27519.1 eukaryotic elongation factor-1 B gamma [Ectocarpus siliculosus]
MALKLWTNPANFRAFKVLIAAEYNGVELEVPEFNHPSDSKSPDFLAKSPLGRVPVLETPQGSIFESNAIARYVARMRRDTELYGVSFFESAQVDSWIDFCAHEIELPATIWCYPVIGYMPYNDAAVSKAKEDLKIALGALEKALLHRTYLVGDKITLADITVASALVYPMKLVVSPEYRKAFPCVTRWFTTCVNQPQFKAVIGTVELAKEEMTAEGAPKAPKKEKKPQPAKKAKKKKEDKKEEDDGSRDLGMPAEEKKAPHPLAVMDKEAKSPFVGDTWKKIYSNNSYEESMKQFWEIFDAEGWSLWICRYKYNAENTRLFMTSNLVGGFIQRSGEIRKWAFGCMQITGEEGKELIVSGAWLIRGQSIQPMVDANDDANWYDWVKVATPVSDADKALVTEMWCSETTVEGRPVLDGKVFK